MSSRATPAPSETATADELRELLHEAEQALSTGGQAGEQIDDLLERLRAAAGEGRHSIERIRAEALRRARQADQLVRDNPYYALGLAAGVGALIGIFAARSCRD